MTATSETTITASTRFVDAANERYAYRRFGTRDTAALPMLCLQHFTGTLDNWDPAVIDQLASDREVILFDNAGIGRSTGTVPPTVAGMATHTFAFLDALGLDRCEVLGFSLGGMIAQQMVLDRPSTRCGIRTGWRSICRTPCSSFIPTRATARCSNGTIRL
jgi:pimeloyl-ACP methyl ester carboxylesterase